MVYTDFTELRFLTLHSFSILGNVNEVKKKARRGIDKRRSKIMRKLVAAALIGVMTMGLTVCGASAADFVHLKISPLFP